MRGRFLRAVGFAAIFLSHSVWGLDTLPLSLNVDATINRYIPPVEQRKDFSFNEYAVQAQLVFQARYSRDKAPDSLLTTVRWQEPDGTRKTTTIQLDSSALFETLTFLEKAWKHALIDEGAENSMMAHVAFHEGLRLRLHSNGHHQLYVRYVSTEFAYRERISENKPRAILLKSEQEVHEVDYRRLSGLFMQSAVFFNALEQGQNVFVLPQAYGYPIPVSILQYKQGWKNVVVTPRINLVEEAEEISFYRVPISLLRMVSADHYLGVVDTNDVGQVKRILTPFRRGAVVASQADEVEQRYKEVVASYLKISPSSCAKDLADQDHSS